MFWVDQLNTPFISAELANNAVNRLSDKPDSHDSHPTPSTASKDSILTEIADLVLTLLACMASADGVASEQELANIVSAVKSTGCPLTDVELKQRAVGATVRATEMGVDNAAIEACKQLRKWRSSDLDRLVVTSMHLVAMANSLEGESERRLHALICQQLGITDEFNNPQSGSRDTVDSPPHPLAVDTPTSASTPPATGGAQTPSVVMPVYDNWKADQNRARALLHEAKEAVSLQHADETLLSGLVSFFGGGREEAATRFDPKKALLLVQEAMTYDWDGTNPAKNPYYEVRSMCLFAMGKSEAKHAIRRYALGVKAGQSRNFAECRSMYLEAFKLDPEFTWSANNLAWLEATCPDSSVRNGPEAVTYALHACEKTCWHCWSFVDTLGAAYAECGDFESAVKCGERAELIAPPEEVAGIQKATYMYRLQQPIRDQ